MTALLGLVVGPAVTGCASTSGDRSERQATPADELRAQLDVADEAFNGRAYEEALERYKAIYLAAKSKDIASVQAESAAQVATTYATLERSAEGDDWMQQAETLASETDKRAWSRLLLARGMRYLKEENLTAAGGTFKALYNFCILHALSPRAIQAATLASMTSLGQDQLDWSLRAVQAAQSTGEEAWEAALWANHAWLLDARERHGDALLAFGKARELAGHAALDRLGRLRADWAYAHGLRMVGRLNEARELLSQTNAIAHSIYVAKPSKRAAEYLGRVLWETGEIDAMEGQKERAREHFLAAREKLVEAGAIEGAPLLLQRLDDSIKALDAPPPTRRIPRVKRGVDTGSGAGESDGRGLDRWGVDAWGIDGRGAGRGR